MPEVRFSYGSGPGSLVAGVLAGIALAVFGGYALIQGWALRLYTVVEVEPEHARWFYLALGILGVACVVGLVSVMAAGRREVVVAADRIEAPRGETSRRTVVIPPESITRLALLSYQGMATLQIRHRCGKVRLRSQHFASRQAFEDCVNAVSTVAPQAARR